MWAGGAEGVAGERNPEPESDGGEEAGEETETIVEGSDAAPSTEDGGHQ